jgi:hypothetical protein
MASLLQVLALDGTVGDVLPGQALLLNNHVGSHPQPPQLHVA